MGPDILLIILGKNGEGNLEMVGFKVKIRLN